MTATLYINAGPRRGQVVVEKRVEEQLIARSCYTFAADKHFGQAAKELAVPKTMLLEVYDRWQRAGEQPLSVSLDSDAETLMITLRGVQQPASHGRQFTGVDPVAVLQSALAAAEPGVEMLLNWRDDSKLAALDVDFHGDYQPSTQRLLVFAEQLRPRPAFAWITKSGHGLRGMYAAAGDLTAGEVASVAALSMLTQEPRASIEIKHDTRVPPPGVEVWRVAEPLDTRALAAWIGGEDAGVPEEAVEEWLDAKSMERGKRYPHTCCSIDPSDAGGRDPVVVSDSGIYCHYCDSRLGRGFRSWAATISPRSFSLLGGCVRQFAHWEHVKYVIAERQYLLPQHIAERAYRAALKIVHGADDPRIDACFYGGRNVIRFDGVWATEFGEAYTKDVQHIIAELPATWDRDGKPIRSKVARLMNPRDLLDDGYPSITPIWGMRIYSHTLPFHDPTRINSVIQPRELRPESAADYRPRYVPEAARMPEADAWRIVEQAFPGCNRSLIRLMIAARGCQEGNVALPPFIYCSGPTGSGKTASTMVASALIGDGYYEVPFTDDRARLRQAILEAKSRGSFCVLNEICKDGLYSRKTLVETMDFLLNLTPSSMSHVLYVGPRPLGALPVIVLTDTTIPDEVAKDGQLARRIVHAHLPQQVLDWQGSIKNTIGRIEYFRLGDKTRAAAANAIVSSVIDQFFKRDDPAFSDVAATLGFKTFAAATRDEVNRLLKRFYDAVQAAPSPPDNSPDRRRWGGDWKVIDRHQESDLADLWGQLADPDGKTSRRCSECDWSKVLSVESAVQFEVKSHGSRVAFRFVGPGLDRPGDSEPMRLEDGRGDGVSLRPLDAAAVPGGSGGSDVCRLDT